MVAVDAPNPEQVLAAQLNAALAGTFTRTFTAHLITTDGAQHTWADFAPVLLPDEAVVDPNVLPPAVQGVPEFVDGDMTVTVTFDTDAGAAKTYVPGDTVSVQLKVSVNDMLLGWAVAPVTKTYVVV